MRVRCDCGGRRWCRNGGRTLGQGANVVGAGKVRSGGRMRCRKCAKRWAYACGTGTKKNVEWWNEPRPLVSNKMNNKILQVF